jgi:hypothetical protein
MWVNVSCYEYFCVYCTVTLWLRKGTTPNISEPPNQCSSHHICASNGPTSLSVRWRNWCSSAKSDSQLSVSMPAGLTTHVELLMLALDVLMEAEPLVVDRCNSACSSSTTIRAGGTCLWTQALNLFYFYHFIHFRANWMNSSYVLTT